MGSLNTVKPEKNIVCPNIWSPGPCFVTVFPIQLGILIEDNAFAFCHCRKPLILGVIESVRREVTVVLKISPELVFENLR